MKRVYLDHAATTYTKPEVLEEMLPYFNEVYGNASSLHSFGREAARAVNEAREKVAKAIGAKPHEIYFTGGGTESDNWAIRGIVKKNGGKGHIITSNIEHHAIDVTLEELEKTGVEVSVIDVDENGIIKLDELEKAIREDTILITVMMANNEIGSIQPIAKIGEIAKNHNIPFHTDAVQAIGAVEIDVEKMNIDMLSMSAHKFYGPKGIGAMYLREGVDIGKLITGGAQERGMRAATTATPLIVGLGKAIELAYTNFEEKRSEISNKRNYLIKKITENIPYVFVNGGMKNRLPNNANFSFQHVEGESVMLRLDLEGIAVSTGSACASGTVEASKILMAIGRDLNLASSGIRMTLGEQNSYEDLDYVVEKLIKIVKDLRFMSPLFKETHKGEQNV